MFVHFVIITWSSLMRLSLAIGNVKIITNSSEDGDASERGKGLKEAELAESVFHITGP